MAEHAARVARGAASDSAGGRQASLSTMPSFAQWMTEEAGGSQPSQQFPSQPQRSPGGVGGGAPRGAPAAAPRPVDVSDLAQIVHPAPAAPMSPVEKIFARMDAEERAEKRRRL